MSMETLKDFLRRTIVFDLYRQIADRRKFNEWVRQGRPVPPPHVVKKQTVREYAARYGIGVLVETGTYYGDTIWKLRHAFRQIFSIELDKTLYEKAVRRMARFDHVRVLHGDSSTVLPVILAEVAEPCLFWLDAHYSGGTTTRGALDTPILQELAYVFAHGVREHVILIDDARCFVGQDDYPTIEQLRAFIARERPGWEFELRDDIIRIHGKPAA